MTQEQKAQAYDEALKRAKAAIDMAADKDLVGGVVRTILPELHESEDERIRRTLVEYFGRYNPENKWDDEFSFKEVLAYLEKQKDASKAIEAVDRIYKYTEVENVANAHDMNDSNPNKKYYCGWNDALGKIAGILQDVYSNEKQKEQKPLSTEETELNSIAFLEQMGYTCIPPGKELKPVEWSEEDKENLDKCCAIIAQPDTFFDPYFRQKCLDFLFEISKKFSLQPKQEWSEEDEKILNIAIEWAETMSGQCSFVNMSSTDFRKIIAWLKSLRPSWKPSEEQMEVLERASTNEYLSAKQFDILVSLYEQLKKL